MLMYKRKGGQGFCEGDVESQEGEGTKSTRDQNCFAEALAGIIGSGSLPRSCAEFSGQPNDAHDLNLEKPSRPYCDGLQASQSWYLNSPCKRSKTGIQLLQFKAEAADVPKHITPTNPGFSQYSSYFESSPTSLLVIFLGFSLQLVSLKAHFAVHRP